MQAELRNKNKKYFKKGNTKYKEKEEGKEGGKRTKEEKNIFKKTPYPSCNKFKQIILFIPTI